MSMRKIFSTLSSASISVKQTAIAGFVTLLGSANAERDPICIESSGHYHMINCQRSGQEIFDSLLTACNAAVINVTQCMNGLTVNRNHASLSFCMNEESSRYSYDCLLMHHNDELDPCVSQHLTEHCTPPTTNDALVAVGVVLGSGVVFGLLSYGMFRLHKYMNNQLQYEPVPASAPLISDADVSNKTVVAPSQLISDADVPMVTIGDDGREEETVQARPQI